MESKYTVYKISGIVVLFLGIYFFVNIDHKKGFDSVLNTIKSDGYEGVVINKYYDKDNHNTPTLVLSSDRVVSLYGDQYSQIDLKDSISKKKNSTILFVFKKNDTIQIDLKKHVESLKKTVDI